MIKKLVSIFIFSIPIVLVLLLGVTKAVQAQFYPEPGSSLVKPYVTPEPCASGQGHLPTSARQPTYCPNIAGACDVFKSGGPQDNAEKYAQCQKEAEVYPSTCANSYEEWLDDKERNFWVKDPEITALGKGGERSRQFLYWVLTHPSIDDHPVILSTWILSRNIALFLILVVVIVMGIGIIVGQRNNFNPTISLTPMIIRIALLLIFLTFSARLVILMVQLADVIMEFFIRNLGVRDLFNIFFSEVAKSATVTDASEAGYRHFTGCTNLNINNIEMVKTSKFLLKATNLTYYFIGIMLIIRKLVLWFLLMVSPFLVILAPFVFIRNTGWIWIGVFFQWLFYGPLFALFLGGLSNIWNSSTHIPWVFDFSRVHIMSESVYPTSINILYGGPAQTLGVWNTSNYVDTFAEYIISLLMLWVVLILPWWLLRIFRDYCCDGIYAMKNILLSMYDNMRTNGGPGPTPSAPTPIPTGTTGLEMNLPKNIDSKIRIENIQDIKRTTTENIVRSVNMQASNIKEIARMETNSVTRQNVASNLDKLQNPFKADTATDRQKLMNLRDEIHSRALQGDEIAKSLSAITSRSSAQQQVAKGKILQSMPKLVPVIQSISVKFNMPKEKTQSIISQVFNNVSYDRVVLDEVAKQSKLPAETTRAVLQSVGRADQMAKAPQQIVKDVANETGVEQAQVKKVITQTAVVIKEKKEVAERVAQQEQVDQATVESVMQASLPVVSEPEKHVEAQIPASKKVSIEDYEEVKKMWTEQYEKGEIPVTENISTRTEWVEDDVVRITNILNKVLSADPHMQEQGLDEIGYILPIFMVNNLSGDELLVYLKAKLEAAKQVEKDIAKEQEIRAKVKADEKEDFVEIDSPKKKEEAKTQTLSQEMTIDEEKKPVESNEVTQATDTQSPIEPDNLDDIKRKLEETS